MAEHNAYGLIESHGMLHEAKKLHELTDSFCAEAVNGGNVEGNRDPQAHLRSSVRGLKLVLASSQAHRKD